MAEIKPISYNIQINKSNLTPEQKEHIKQQQEQVATGVGGVAGLSSATATKVASKKGLNSESAKSAENVLHQMMDKVKHTSQTISGNSEAATGLWGKFKSDILMFKNDIIARLDKFRNMKFIGKLIDNPITKKLAGFAGGALAFFVLITGVNKAVKTGAIAVDDFKHQYNEFNQVA